MTKQPAKILLVGSDTTSATRLNDSTPENVKIVSTIADVPQLPDMLADFLRMDSPSSTSTKYPTRILLNSMSIPLIKTTVDLLGNSSGDNR